MTIVLDVISSLEKYPITKEALEVRQLTTLKVCFPAEFCFAQLVSDSHPLYLCRKLD